MKEKATQLFNKLEEQRHELVAGYEPLSPEQLAFKPQPDSWSLLQVMRHLVTAERQSLTLIQRRISREKEVAKAGIGSTVRYLILKLAIILPIKYKAPKIAEVKEEFPDFELMKEEWQTIRADLKKLIDEHDDEVLSKAVYKHPRAGPLNMNQALEFMIIHITHHQKQMGRIKRDSLFP